MALFDKIFKKPEAVIPQEWSLIVLAISKPLADIRTKFYVKCLDAMIEFAKRAEFEIDPPPYAEDVQGLNIKAFQLILASLIIGKRRYITPQHGKQFADLLWAHLLGNNLTDGVKHGQALFQDTDDFPRLFTFFCKVGEGITGDINPAHGMFLLSNFGSAFVESCYRSVATAFSDSNIENVIREEMPFVNEQIQIISRRFDEELSRMRASSN